MEDVIRWNWTPHPQQKQMNDQCTCSGVNQASSRVAGLKSRGNFLSGGGGGGGVFVAFQWVTNCRCLYNVCVVTAPPHLTESVCAHVCVRECVTKRATARETETRAEFLITSVFHIHFFPQL